MKRAVVVAAALAVLGAVLLAWRNHRALAELDRRFEADTLAAEDRRAVAESRRLKAAYGPEVWPGFGRADLPQVLYNDRREFLAGWPAPPPAGWERAGGAPLLDVPVWRRRAEDPRPFAVQIEGRWAGRYPVRRVLDRGRVRRAREGMDPISRALVPVSLSTAPADLYVAQLLHTAFHAYQARRSEERFYEAVELQREAAGRYPFRATAELWTEEGRALGRVLSAGGREEACRGVETFRSVRDRRRRRAALDSTLTAFERSQEWLRGLAKYAEFRLYRRAAEGSGAPPGVEYREGTAHWGDDLERLRSSLGRAGPDRRFALSGLGQALALQRLVPDWKNAVLPGGGSLEELLAETCGRGGDADPEPDGAGAPPPDG